jgi:DNA repair exonuclease SbcCD ATPase subunit
MARAGLYKSDVKRARDALLGRGRHPSLDAVRIELGNTGSKTTIHKYLKELEVEEGSMVAGISLSDELQGIVGALAARLHEEADVRIAVMQAACTARLQEQAAQAHDLQRQLDASQGRERHLEQQLAAERHTLDSAGKQLQQESIARHTAEQHVRDLRERLAENEAHLKSLESKHDHARNALDHFRQASKEQRDQDHRRHEQQLQQSQAELRQLQQQLAARHEETTRLNQEGARLVSDLLHARQALAETKGAAERREAEWTRLAADTRQRAAAKSALQEQQLTETRLELAGNTREIKLQQKELARIQRLYDQLAEEKVTWRHERAAMEEMLRQADQE